MLKSRSKFSIIVENDGSGILIKWRCITELLGNPGIGRVVGDVEVNDTSRPQFDDDEKEEGLEEEGVSLNKVASP